VTSLELRRLVRRLAKVRARDLVELAAALLVATRAEWGLRYSTLPATALALGVGVHAMEPAEQPARIQPDRFALPGWAWRRARIASLVMRRWPFGDTCLRHALVTGSRLAALDPEIMIGIRAAAAPQGIAAHAWLRIDGVDLDPLATEYLAFGAP
jgi:Transglutaminase-like superfamily